MSKKSISNRTLSKKDNISEREALSIINHYRKDINSGLIIPDELKRERANSCGYCGRSKEPHQFIGTYFGEEFHQKCIDSMIRGERNE